MLHQVVCLECNTLFKSKEEKSRFCSRKCYGQSVYGKAVKVYGNRGVSVLEPQRSKIFKISGGLLCGLEEHDLTSEVLDKVRKNGLFNLRFQNHVN